MPVLHRVFLLFRVWLRQILLCSNTNPDYNIQPSIGQGIVNMPIHITCFCFWTFTKVFDTCYLTWKVPCTCNRVCKSRSSFSFPSRRTYWNPKTNMHFSVYFREIQTLLHNAKSSILCFSKHFYLLQLDICHF